MINEQVASQWLSEDGSILAMHSSYAGAFLDPTPVVPFVDSHLIADPPYSSATHDAWDGNAGEDESAARKNAEWAAANGKKALRSTRKALPYAAWTHDDAMAFVEYMHHRITGWMVIITDDVLAPTFKRAMKDAGRCTFPILPFYSPYSRLRISGDGPSNWTCQVVVSRPREDRFRKWGTLPGGYAGPPAEQFIVGGKPLWLMRALVRDYSRPGDVIVDPCCGAGTTALAASMEGRFGITCEMDKATYDLAVKRLAKPRDIDMFSGQTSQAAPVVADEEIARAKLEGIALGRAQLMAEIYEEIHDRAQLEGVAS
jgi:hypothetical protein